MSYQNSNASRGLASNNPFRRDLDDNYGENNYSNNSINNNSTSSTFNRNSPTPLDKRTSTNPFLDDVASENANSIPQYTNNNHNGNSNTNGTVYRENTNNIQYPSAEQEKERLRQRYIEKDLESNKHNNNGSDLPPSYDEIADRNKNQYPKEKASHNNRNEDNQLRSNNGQRLRHHSNHRHNSNSSNNNSSNNNSRSHRDSQEKSRRYHSNNASSTNGSNAKHSRSRDRKEKKDKSKKNVAIVSKNVDTIDKLDVTGLFGGSFHHDGPFDACAPHRNKNNKAAPVLAFPIDGPNSTIGGANTKKSAMDEVFGNDPTLDDDNNNHMTSNTTTIKNNDLYSLKNGNATKDAIRSNQLKNVRNIDATARVKVHGVETSGLGSSTFLDGAPATGVPQSGNSYTGYGNDKNSGLQRNKTISYGGMKKSFNSNTNGSHHNANDLRRNLSTHSHQGNPNSFNNNRTPIEYNRAYSADSSVDHSLRNSNDGTFTRNYANNNSEYEDEDDLYINNTSNSSGVRFDSNAKKSGTSTGSKFLKRVKSLKVGSKKN